MPDLPPPAPIPWAVVRSGWTRGIRTWHLEAVVMLAALASVVALTNPASWQHWVGAAAVFVGTRAVSVADRLREKEQSGLDLPVECVGELRRYTVAKEFLWLVYFVSLEAWPALVGVAIFLGYPFWRAAYRRAWPIGR